MPTSDHTPDWSQLPLVKLKQIAWAVLTLGSSQPKWENSVQGHELRPLLICLAHAPPDIFDDLCIILTGKLSDHPCTRCWLVANQLLGSFWPALFKATPPKALKTPQKSLPSQTMVKLGVQFSITRNLAQGAFIQGQKGGSSSRPKHGTRLLPAPSRPTTPASTIPLPPSQQNQISFLATLWRRNRKLLQRFFWSQTPCSKLMAVFFFTPSPTAPVTPNHALLFGASWARRGNTVTRP